jgi:hypothetical protein
MTTLSSPPLPASAVRALLSALTAAGLAATPPIASPASAQAQDEEDLRLRLVLPPPTPTESARHARGGGSFKVIFGDSADYLRHNVANLALASTATIAVLWVLPEHVTYWRRDVPPLRRLANAYTKPPRWDTDPWYFNYIGHPLAGMQTYLMERNWGAGQVRSFLFSTAASVAWEYGFEAFMEQPSIQDLLVTSPSGWVLGEASYRLTQRLRRNGFTTAEKVIVVIINPTYVLQHGFR